MNRAPELIAPERLLRRDAAANREQILEAAADVFARHGMAGSVEEIARLSGLGIGTLYRRFPTKDALIDELVRQQLLEIIAAGDDALEADSDEGLKDFLFAVGDILVRGRGCLSRLWVSTANHPLVAQARSRIGELVRVGQERGHVRSEVLASDVSLVIWSLIGVIDVSQDVAPDLWRRSLEIGLAGLLNDAPPLQSPSPSERQLQAITTRLRQPDRAN